MIEPGAVGKKGGMPYFATNPAPLCPHCGQPMRLARIVPRLGGLPELRTYECRACGVSFTQAAQQQEDEEASYFVAEAV
jgi:transposase-like protein